MQSYNPPSFLVKLERILSNPLNEHIIRWDKQGQAISIFCIHDLEEVILPEHFRHSKFASFVRQLNMYGFSKRKADKNAVAAFYHPCFSKDQINFMGMVKKGKKQNKPTDTLIKKQRSSTCLQSEHNQYSQESQTGQSSKNLIFSAQPQPQFQDQQAQKKLPQINQLIAEFSSLIQPYLNGPIDSSSYHELEYLIKQPRFERVNSAAFGLMDWDQMSTFNDVHFGKVWSEKMEFIL